MIFEHTFCGSEFGVLEGLPSLLMFQVSVEEWKEACFVKTLKRRRILDVFPLALGEFLRERELIEREKREGRRACFLKKWGCESCF